MIGHTCETEVLVFFFFNKKLEGEMKRQNGEWTISKNYKDIVSFGFANSDTQVPIYSVTSTQRATMESMAGSTWENGSCSGWNPL